jgi:hypothetical protein
MKQAPKPNANMHWAVLTLTDLIKDRLTEAIGLISTKLLPVAVEDESKAMFSRGLADFQRYYMEYAEQAQIPELGAEARQNYSRAIDLFKVMGLHFMDQLASSQLNLGLLLGDYLDQKKRAAVMLEQLYHEYSASLEKYPEDIRLRVQETVELMRDSIERFNPKTD